jgi:hypothetical protein
LTESNEQCHHAADLCLCQPLQAWNGNREGWGLSVSAHTGPTVSTRINVLLKLPEATWLVLQSGSSDTHSHIVLPSPAVSCTPILSIPTGFHRVRHSILYDPLRHVSSSVWLRLYPIVPTNLNSSE